MEKKKTNLFLAFFFINVFFVSGGKKGKFIEFIKKKK